jgi:ParB/RepB/Spo0J family partition protein
MKTLMTNQMPDSLILGHHDQRRTRMATTATKTGKVADPAPSRRLEYVPIDQITVQDGFNPRQGMDADDLADLAASIKEHGVLQPILLREHVGEGFYTIVAGHRRHLAAQAAGLTEIPALIGEHGTDPQAAAIAALVENIQREDLKPLEQATAITALIDGGMKQVDVARLMGKSERWLRERLRILKLTPAIQTMIAEDKLTTTAVRQLEQIAEISPAAADHAAQVLASGAVSTAEFLEDPAMAMPYDDHLLDSDDPNPLDVGLVAWLGTPGAHLDALPIADDERPALEKRVKAAATKAGMGRTDWLPIDADVTGMAHEAGKLLNLESTDGLGQTRHNHFVQADPDFWAPIIRAAVEAYEAEGERKAAARAEAASKPAPENPFEAAQEARKQAEAASKAVHEKAAPHAEQANRALGRKISGMTSVDVAHPPVTALLLELAAGHRPTLATVVEAGLAHCDPDFATKGAGEHAYLTRVVGEPDHGKAAAFIVGAWVAYYFADRRDDRLHPAAQDHTDAIQALVRQAAKELKLLPGTRPSQYLEAVRFHRLERDYHGREANRRRILLELKDSRGGLDRDALKTATEVYKYDANTVGAAPQLYSYMGGAFDAALADLQEAGAVELKDAAEKTKVKITARGKELLKAPAAAPPVFPDIDPDPETDDDA